VHVQQRPTDDQGSSKVSGAVFVEVNMVDTVLEMLRRSSNSIESGSLQSINLSRHLA